MTSAYRDEVLLNPNPGRFVILPIKFPGSFIPLFVYEFAQIPRCNAEIWQFYKRAEASFWVKHLSGNDLLSAKRRFSRPIDRSLKRLIWSPTLVTGKQS